MAYNAPGKDSVNFGVESYSQPSSDNIVFDIQEGLSSSSFTETNTATVTDDNGSNPTGIQKVQPVKVSWGNSNPTNGSGDVEFSDNVTVDSQDKLCVFESDGITRRSYEVAYIDFNNKEAWLWVYGSWDRDNTEQIIVAAGGGDGTDYSSPQNATGNNGSGSNPWQQSGVNAFMVHHLEGNANDSSGNGNDGSVNGPTVDDGQFGDAYNYNGSSDYIEVASNSVDFNTSSTGYTSVLWFNWDTVDSNTNDRLMRVKDSGSSNNDHKNTSEAFRAEWSDNSQETIASISESTWYFHGYTATASSSPTITGYVNGSQQVSFGANHPNDGSGHSISIGGATDNGGGFGSSVPDATIDSARIYEDEKSGDWMLSEYDASPKGGQDFFSWSGPQPTTVTSYNRKKQISVNSNATSPGSAKVQPVILNGGDNDGKTGTGNIGYDTSEIDTTDTQSKLESICFFDEDEETIKAYEVENPEDLGTTNDVVVWVYDSGWTADGSHQVTFAYGGGVGEDQSMSGIGDNPWGLSGINAVMVQHMEDDPVSFNGSSPTGVTGVDIEGATPIDDGQYDGGIYVDATDDWIRHSSLPSDYASQGSPAMAVAWVNMSGTTGGWFATQSYNTSSGGSEYGRQPHLLEIQDDGTIRTMTDVPSDSNSWKFLGGSSGYNDGNWHQVVSIISSSGDRELYVDTGLDASDSLSDRDYYENTNGQVGAGFDSGGYNSNRSPDCDLDEIRYYSDNKSTSWIDADYEASPKGGQTFFTQSSGEFTGDGPSISFTLNSPSGGAVFSKPIGQLYTVGYDFNVDSGSSGTVRLFENSTEISSFSHDGSGDLNFTYNADNVAGGYSWYVQFDDGSSTVDSSTRSYSIDSTVSGTVYNDQGDALQNADVVLVDETNQVVAGTTTSDSNGDYSFTIDGVNDDVNAVFHVAAKYDDGTERFNFFSNPFMEE